MIQLPLKLLLKQIIFAVYHDFHWLLVATKLLTAKLHPWEWKILERAESEVYIRWELVSALDILPPTPQPCCKLRFKHPNDWDEEKSYPALVWKTTVMLTITRVLEIFPQKIQTSRTLHQIPIGLIKLKSKYKSQRKQWYQRCNRLSFQITVTIYLHTIKQFHHNFERSIRSWPWIIRCCNILKQESSPSQVTEFSNAD